MPATIEKRKLSGSTDGRGILVVATATAGTLLHTAIAGTTAGTFDEIWLWVANTSSSLAPKLTIEFGGTGTADQIEFTAIPTESGLLQIVPGFILQNSVVVRAFASSASVLTVFGYVHTMT